MLELCLVSRCINYGQMKKDLKWQIVGAQFGETNNVKILEKLFKF